MRARAEFRAQHSRSAPRPPANERMPKLIVDNAQLKEIALNLGDAIAKLLSLQADLLRTIGDADGVQAALIELFSQPAPLSVASRRNPGRRWRRGCSSVSSPGRRLR